MNKKLQIRISDPLTDEELGATIKRLLSSPENLTEEDLTPSRKQSYLYLKIHQS